VITEARFNNTFYYIRYDREVRDWLESLSLSKVDFFSSGEMTDSLRMG